MAGSDGYVGKRSLSSSETCVKETRLRDDLRGRGFDFTIRDPLYQEFLKAWTAQEDSKWREAVELTPQQREDRGKLAARIVEDLRRETDAT